MNQLSPLAFVHPEAKLGDNNIIGPLCYIDKDTVLGDNHFPWYCLKGQDCCRKQQPHHGVCARGSRL